METLQSLLNKQLKSNISFKSNDLNGYLFDRSVNISHFNFDTKQTISVTNKELTRLQPSIKGQTLLTLRGKGDAISAKDALEYKINRLIFKLSTNEFILPVRFLHASRKYKRSGGQISVFKYFNFMPKKILFKKEAPTSKYTTRRVTPNSGTVSMVYAHSFRPKLTRKIRFSFLTGKELMKLKKSKKSKER
jgi:hypothetical protein